LLEDVQFLAHRGQGFENQLQVLLWHHQLEWHQDEVYFELQTAPVELGQTLALNDSVSDVKPVLLEIFLLNGSHELDHGFDDHSLVEACRIEYENDIIIKFFGYPLILTETKKFIQV